MYIEESDARMMSMQHLHDNFHYCGYFLMSPHWILLVKNKNELNKGNLRSIMRFVWQLRFRSLLHKSGLLQSKLFNSYKQRRNRRKTEYFKIIISNLNVLPFEVNELRALTQ